MIFFKRNKTPEESIMALKQLARFGESLILVTAVFFVLYNTYFGWNLEPMSPLELLCDNIAVGGFRTGIALHLFPAYKIYLNWTKGE